MKKGEYFLITYSDYEQCEHLGLFQCLQDFDMVKFCKDKQIVSSDDLGYELTASFAKKIEFTEILTEHTQIAVGSSRTLKICGENHKWGHKDIYESAAIHANKDEFVTIKDIEKMEQAVRDKARKEGRDLKKLWLD